MEILSPYKQQYIFIKLNRYHKIIDIYIINLKIYTIYFESLSMKLALLASLCIISCATFSAHAAEDSMIQEKKSGYKLLKQAFDGDMPILEQSSTSTSTSTSDNDVSPMSVEVILPCLSYSSSAIIQDYTRINYPAWLCAGDRFSNLKEVLNSNKDKLKSFISSGRYYDKSMTLEHYFKEKPSLDELHALQEAELTLKDNLRSASDEFSMPFILSAVTADQRKDYAIIINFRDNSLQALAINVLKTLPISELEGLNFSFLRTTFPDLYPETKSSK